MLQSLHPAPHTCTTATGLPVIIIIVVIATTTHITTTTMPIPRTPTRLAIIQYTAPLQTATAMADLYVTSKIL